MTDILLERVDKSYGGKTILKDYRLEVKQGEFLCISGESGSGKTTLLNIIGLMERPDSGKVVVKGIENPKITKKEGRELLRKELFFIFQNYGLVEEKTVQYNLEVSMRFSKKKKEDMAGALKKVGLLPEIVKQKVFTLSGGEQQRVALARLYLRDFSIILADEPTGSLDSGNRDRVLKILREMNQNGKTVIVVSHDKEVEKCATRVVFLSPGSSEKEKEPSDKKYMDAEEKG